MFGDISEFFSEKTSFGSKSTAIKILFSVRDLGGFNKSIPIDRQKELVEDIVWAIEACIDYKQYQSLQGVAKNRIRSAIAQHLFKASKKLFPEIIVNGEYGEHRGVKGIGVYSFFITSWGDAIFFPKLFHDRLWLKEQIGNIFKNELDKEQKELKIAAFNQTKAAQKLPDDVKGVIAGWVRAKP